MGRIDELASAEFARWEQRARGWQVFSEPVRPEPPFEEFTGYRLSQTEAATVDDGRKPGFLASFFDSLEKKLNPPPVVAHEEVAEPEPVASTEPLSVEFVAFLPATLEIDDNAFSALLDALASCREPVGFELLAAGGKITVSFAGSPSDAALLQRHLTAFLPKLSFSQTSETLATSWHDNEGMGFIVEFGLAHEIMLPLETSQPVDPFIGLVAALNEVPEDEVALFQILFQGVRHPWAGSVWRSVTDSGGKALFVNRPHLITGTKAKLEKPLFGAVVRTAVKAETFDRSAAVVSSMAGTLRTFAKHEGNRLIPLSNEDYDFEEHEADLISRQSRRCGMLLNRDELLGFVHLPTDEVAAPKLERQRFPTKAAPATVLSPTGLLLGHNIHAGRSTPVRLTADQRTSHLYTIGVSGSGKSTFLFNLIQQDIATGEGIAVLDPHGDLVDRILGAIPSERIKDVILVDPADKTSSIGFNILSAHSDLEKRLLASDLVSVFARLSTSWGDQMESVFRNSILAFLESSEGGTLWDLRRFLLDPKFRDKFLTTVKDPDIQYYWRKGFAHLGGNKSIGPVLTRLEMFLAPKPIRYMVAQPVNRLDFADILDSGKILLARLSQGDMGKENSYLLGSLLVAKLQETAMARQEQEEANRRDFWLYCDEFHNFITPSMAEILTGTRKYRLGLVLAHQHLRQLERDAEVSSAVLGCHTRIAFHVGDDDARKLASGLTSFTPQDLQNLGTGEAIVRVGRSSADFNMAVSLPAETDSELAKARRAEVTEASRRTYGTPRADLEAAEHLQFQIEEPEPPKPAEVPKDAEPFRTVPKAAERFGKIPHVAEDCGTVPKVAESPKPVPQTVEPKPPADLGRGGEQHRAIQKRLKEAAEKFGYLVSTEKPVLENSGSVDLALESSRRTIAVEITVTTTIDHEVGNVTKCLRAEFQTVAVVSSSETKLKQMREAVGGALGPELAARVGYFTPDQFLAHLEVLAKEDAPQEVLHPAETKIAGYRVRFSAPKLSAEELKAREAATLKIVADAMKEKPRDKRG